MTHILKTILISACGVIAASAAAASEPASKNEPALRVQVQPARARQTPKTDFASMVRRGAATPAARAAAGQYPLTVIADPSPSPAMSPDAVLARIELAQSAMKLKTLNEYKAALRLVALELREAIAEDQWPYALDVTAVDGAVETAILTSREEAETLLAEIEANLQTASDMTQMAQLQLQDAMQKHNQAVTMLSSIMKAQNETMKAIINNMK